MLDQIINFLKFLFDLFNKLPEETKDNVKRKTAEKFEKVFRDFYRSESKGEAT